MQCIYYPQLSSKCMNIRCKRYLSYVLILLYWKLAYLYLFVIYLTTLFSN
jgi:hypothetical protein